MDYSKDWNETWRTQTNSVQGCRELARIQQEWSLANQLHFLFPPCLFRKTNFHFGIKGWGRVLADLRRERKSDTNHNVFLDIQFTLRWHAFGLRIPKWLRFPRIRKSSSLLWLMVKRGEYPVAGVGYLCHICIYCSGTKLEVKEFAYSFPRACLIGTAMVI